MSFSNFRTWLTTVTSSTCQRFVKEWNKYTLSKFLSSDMGIHYNIDVWYILPLKEDKIMAYITLLKLRKNDTATIEALTAKLNVVLQDYRTSIFMNFIVFSTFFLFRTFGNPVKKWE